MICKPTECKRLNIESRIWIQFFRHSTFDIRHSTCSGFSLVETLVAIAILLIAVVGPISIIGNSLHQIYYAKDEMLAINLAQEGIEMVRQKRDSNMLANEVPATVTAWDSGITAGTYTVDAPSFSIIACATCDTKVYKNSSGFYSQGTQGVGSVETQFTGRTIVITDVVAGREKRIASTVTWKTGGDIRSIVVTEYIFKLRP